MSIQNVVSYNNMYYWADSSTSICKNSEHIVQPQPMQMLFNPIPTVAAPTIKKNNLITLSLSLNTPSKVY